MKLNLSSCDVRMHDNLKIDIENHDFLSELAKIEIANFAKSLLRLFCSNYLAITECYWVK